MRLQGVAAPDPAKGLDLVISPLVLSFPVQLMVRFLLTGLRYAMRTVRRELRFRVQLEEPWKPTIVCVNVSKRKEG